MSQALAKRGKFVHKQAHDNRAQFKKKKKNQMPNLGFFMDLIISLILAWKINSYNKPLINWELRPLIQPKWA